MVQHVSRWKLRDIESMKHNVVARLRAKVEFRAKARGICELLLIKIIQGDPEIGMKLNETGV